MNYYRYEILGDPIRTVVLEFWAQRTKHFEAVNAWLKANNAKGCRSSDEWICEVSFKCDPDSKLWRQGRVGWVPRRGSSKAIKAHLETLRLPHCPDNHELRDRINETRGTQAIDLICEPHDSGGVCMPLPYVQDLDGVMVLSVPSKDSAPPAVATSKVLKEAEYMVLQAREQAKWERCEEVRKRILRILVRAQEGGAKCN